MKRTRYWLKGLLLLFFMLVNQVQGWAGTSDSLLNILRLSGLNDSTRLNIYLQLSDNALLNNNNQVLKYAQIAHFLARKTKQIPARAKAINLMATHYLYANRLDTSNVLLERGLLLLKDFPVKALEADFIKKLGAVQYYTGNTDSALYYFKISLQISEEIGDSVEMIKLYNNLGAIAIRVRKLDEAIVYFYKCLAFDEKSGDKTAIATSCNNIGTVFLDKKDFGSARKYLERAKQLRMENKDTIGYVKASLNLGIILKEEGKNREVVQLLSKLLPLIQENDFPNEFSQILNNLGIANKFLGNYDRALAHFERALALREKYGILKDMPAVLSNIGDIYALQGKYENALSYLRKAAQQAKEAKQIDIERNAVNIILKCYLETHQSALALPYLDRLNELNEAFYNNQATSQIAEVQTKYETEKKDRENLYLVQENNIKQLELLNNNAQIKTQNYTIAALAFAILIIVFIVLWRVNVNHLKKKQKEFLDAQKMQQEKERISRDLHDNVGGQLSYVLFSLDGLVDLEAPKRKEIAASIHQSVKQVIANLRETIWAISDAEITAQDFSDKLKVYARNMFRHTATSLHIEEHLESPYALNALSGLNLFRICQEIINNAFKHAQAKEIYISLTLTDVLSIEIKDNGVGFDTSVAGAGYGLSNIEKRANETGISVSVQAKPMQGVSYKLVV